MLTSENGPKLQKSPLPFICSEQMVIFVNSLRENMYVSVCVSAQSQDSSCPHEVNMIFQKEKIYV